MPATQKIVPCLWYDRDCEEAVNYYIEVFNGSPSPRGDSRVVSIQRYEQGMEVPGVEELEGKVLTIVFELAGQRFMALDGGPVFKFTEATSFYVECDDQAEVDYFWEKLSAVPEAEQCGWLKDRYGLSWQIVPKRFEELVSSEDHKKAIATINAMLPMKKLDIAELERVYNEA